MQPRAVKRSAVPRYPTRLDVLADRTLLHKHLPPSWKSCAGMAGAVTILLAVNSSLARQPQPKQASGSSHAVVAPIFQHGEGRGAVGCVVVNPPIFLSEQDAMQVIREELKKAGIALGKQPVPLDGISIPQTREKWNVQDDRLKTEEIPTGKSKPLMLQGTDPARQVGVVMVESDDYFDLGGGRSPASVQEYDFRHVAQDVRDRAAAGDRDLYLGAFYDPVAAHVNSAPKDKAFDRQLHALYEQSDKATDPAVKKQLDAKIDALWQKHIDPLKEESRRQLRLQVKDFIDWLKGQGAI